METFFGGGLSFSLTYDIYAFKTFFVFIPEHFTDEIYQNTTADQPLIV